MLARSNRAAPKDGKRLDVEALVFLPRMIPGFSHSVRTPQWRSASANHCRHFGTIRLSWMAPIGFGLLGFGETAEEGLTYAVSVQHLPYFGRFDNRCRYLIT